MSTFEYLTLSINRHFYIWNNQSDLYFFRAIFFQLSYIGNSWSSNACVIFEHTLLYSDVDILIQLKVEIVRSSYLFIYLDSIILKNNMYKNLIRSFKQKCNKIRWYIVQN